MLRHAVGKMVHTVKCFVAPCKTSSGSARFCFRSPQKFKEMGVLRILATSLLILLGLITSATTINNANPGLLELRKTTPPSTRVMSLRLRGGNDDARMQDVLVSPTSRGRPPQNPPGSTQKGSERIYAVGGNSGVYLFTNTVESYAPADGARSR